MDNRAFRKKKFRLGCVKKKKLTWEIRPDEASAIKLAFELHHEGKGIKLIAEALTKLGYRSRRGAPMNKATVGEWFRNPYPFAGCTVWNTHDHKLKPKPRSVWIVVEGTHPAITDVEMAEDVYQRVEQRKTGKRRRVRMGEYLFMDRALQMPTKITPKIMYRLVAR